LEYFHVCGGGEAQLGARNETTGEVQPNDAREALCETISEKHAEHMINFANPDGSGEVVMSQFKQVMMGAEGSDG
jgi:hypothetical protein